MVVVVRKHAKPGLRESVDSFFYPDSDDKEAQLKRDLFLHAFTYMKNKDHTDPLSFFQIAGIHGLPFEPYDPQPKDPPKPVYEGDPGYCEHGSNLFPIWHRLYIQLIEQALIVAAKEYLKSLSDESKRKEGMAVVEKLRWPYWDWANQRSATYGVPTIFTAEEVLVKFPVDGKIDNPLRAFKLPVNVPDPDNDPNDPKINWHPDLIAGRSTSRHPDANFESQDDKLNLAILRGVQDGFRTGCFGMFKVDKWDKFADHSLPSPNKPEETEDDKQQRGASYSLEGVHDLVHRWTAGPTTESPDGGYRGGTMGFPQTAGFDPIFFFHHCNVDRLYALWQLCYPDEFLSKDEANFKKHLAPFRHTEHSYWMAKQMRKQVDEVFNSTYPEVVEARKLKLTPAQIREQLLLYYQPISYGALRWYLNVTGIPKHKYTATYSVLAYIQMNATDALAADRCDIRYAGEIFVFSRGKNATCGNCRGKDAASGDEGMLIQGAIDLTSTLTSIDFRLNAVGRVTPDLGSPVAFQGQQNINPEITLIAEQCGGEREIITPGEGEWKEVKIEVVGEFHVKRSEEAAIPPKKPRKGKAKAAAKVDPIPEDRCVMACHPLLWPGKESSHKKPGKSAATSSSSSSGKRRAAQHSASSSSGSGKKRDREPEVSSSDEAEASSAQKTKGKGTAARSRKSSRARAR